MLYVRFSVLLKVLVHIMLSVPLNLTPQLLYSSQDDDSGIEDVEPRRRPSPTDMGTEEVPEEDHDAGETLQDHLDTVKRAREGDIEAQDDLRRNYENFFDEETDEKASWDQVEQYIRDEYLAEEGQELDSAESSDDSAGSSDNDSSGNGNSAPGPSGDSAGPSGESSEKVNKRDRSDSLTESENSNKRFKQDSSDVNNDTELGDFIDPDA